MSDFEYEKLRDAVSALRHARIIQEEEALRFRHLIEQTKQEEAK
jgi:hypothetical protein